MVLNDKISRTLNPDISIRLRRHAFKEKELRKVTDRVALVESLDEIYGVWRRRETPME